MHSAVNLHLCQRPCHLRPMDAFAVPGSELEKINQTFSGLLSFSRSFKYSTAAPRWASLSGVPADGQQATCMETSAINPLFCLAGWQTGARRQQYALRQAASGLRLLGREAWLPPGDWMRQPGKLSCSDCGLKHLRCLHTTHASEVTVLSATGCALLCLLQVRRRRRAWLCRVVAPGEQWMRLGTARKPSLSRVQPAQRLAGV